MNKSIITAMLMAVCAAGTANAQNATHCISVGYTEGTYKGGEGQTLKNQCNRKLEVVWCHNNPKRKHRDSRCGYEGKYYQKHVVLKPGEVKSNSYNLPPTGTISYGACFGGYYSTKTKGMENGRFQCKQR